ncbi:hypothetical protein Lal_00025166 [Lupinus albus]|nr:hypothetical protein Lal_00025166 [Lupinus albus]
MTTNLAECVNSVLKGSRALPITALVQTTYYRLTNVIKENQRQSTCQLVRSFSRETGVAEVEAPSRFGGRHSKIYTVYELEFQPIGNEEYWPSYSGPSFIPNPIMRRKRTSRPKTTRIHNEMDEVEPQLIKKCGWCRTEGHNRKTCPYRMSEVGQSSTQPNDNE